MKFISTVLSALLVCATLPTLGAQTFSVHDVAQRVDAHYNHLKSMKLDYTEHYAGMGMQRTETGTLLLKKPGRMRWNYNNPVGKVFVLDGKNAYFYTPGDAQAQRIPAKKLDDLRSPLQFLLGHTQLEKELQHLAMTTSAGKTVLSGVPKGMEERIKALSVTCEPATGTITGLKLQEVDGSVTEFFFHNLQENFPVRDAEFNFTAPSGVVIVDGLPPS